MARLGNHQPAESVRRCPTAGRRRSVVRRGISAEAVELWERLAGTAERVRGMGQSVGHPAPGGEDDAGPPGGECWRTRSRGNHPERSSLPSHRSMDMGKGRSIAEESTRAGAIVPLEQCRQSATMAVHWSCGLGQGLEVTTGVILALLQGVGAFFTSWGRPTAVVSPWNDGWQELLVASDQHQRFLEELRELQVPGCVPHLLATNTALLRGNSPRVVGRKL